MENIEKRVLDIISEVLYGDCLYEDVQLDDVLSTEHGADSVDKVDIVMRVETELGISISDDELETYMSCKGTTRDLVNAINQVHNN